MAMSSHDIGCTEGQLLKARIWPASSRYLAVLKCFKRLILHQMDTTVHSNNVKCLKAIPLNLKYLDTNLPNLAVSQERHENQA